LPAPRTLDGSTDTATSSTVRSQWASCEFQQTVLSLTLSTRFAFSPNCGEAASVGFEDELTGQAVVAFVVTTTSAGRVKTDPAEVPKEMIAHVRQTLGPFSAPKFVFVVPDVPKTRSGKSGLPLLDRLGFDL
jgi:acyl-CoA synthetase (AMP-forming)/AMP-acid ligase II